MKWSKHLLTVLLHLDLENEMIRAHKPMSLTEIILGLEHDDRSESVDSFVHYLRTNQAGVTDRSLKAPSSTEKYCSRPL